MYGTSIRACLMGELVPSSPIYPFENRQLHAAVSVSQQELDRIFIDRHSETFTESTRVINMLYPSYLNLYETGELAQRAAAAWEILRSCTICPQNS